MHVQEIETAAEGVPPARGYRLIWLAELQGLRRYVSRTLAAELDQAAAPALAKGWSAFKFWPAPSEAGQLAGALRAVRS